MIQCNPPFYSLHSNDIGVFANLTNSYCLTAVGGSENFYR